MHILKTRWIKADLKNLKNNFKLPDRFIARSLSLILTLCYSYTIDWYNSNIFISTVLILGFYYLSNHIFKIATKYLIAVFFKPSIIPFLDLSLGIPTIQKTAITYLVKASCLEEVELAFCNMDKSFKNNAVTNNGIPDFQDNLIAIYLSSSDDKNIIKREIELTRVMQSKYGKDRIFLFYRNPLIKNWGVKWGAYQDLFCYLYNGQKRPSCYTDLRIIGRRNYARKKNIPFFMFNQEFVEDGLITKLEASSGIIGDINTLSPGLKGQRVENVIICDSDNEWPADSIRKTIGKIAHPDNQKYGIFQPLIEISNFKESLYSAIKRRNQIISRCEILFTWRIHNQTTFYGKGAIHIGKYISNVIKPQVLSPETKSHDFQEALYLPCALMCDIFVLERTANSYLSDVKKHFRWMVGDIQGLIQQTKLWKLLDEFFQFNFKAFWKTLKKKDKIENRKFLLEHIERAVITDVVFAGWVFLGVVSLLSPPHLLSISDSKQAITNLILIIVISTIVILPKIILPGIISFRQNRYGKCKAALLSSIAGLVDALMLTVIFLQNLIYNSVIALRSFYIVLKREPFIWQSMAVIERENSKIGLMKYIFRLRYSFIAGLLLFYITYNALYPEIILHNILVVLIFSLVLGPFFSWFTAQKQNKKFYFKIATSTTLIGTILLISLCLLKYSRIPNYISELLLNSPNRVLLVDDFNESSFINKLGGKMSANIKNKAVCQMDFVHCSKLLHNNYALQLKYELPKKGHSFYWTKLGKETLWNSKSSTPLDLSTYRYLSFWIKGEIPKGLRVELHQDISKDGVFNYNLDRSSYVYLSRHLSSKKNGWQKVVIPLSHFKKIKDWKNILGIAFVFVNRSKTELKDAVYIDNIVFGSNYFFLSKFISQPVAFKFNDIIINNQILKDGCCFDITNNFSIEFNEKINHSIECVKFEVSIDNGKTWDTIGSDYDNSDNIYKVCWEPNILKPEENCQVRTIIQDINGNQSIISPTIKNCSITPLTDEQFLDLIERRAFNFFWENQSPMTGLFADSSWGGDASIAVTGFGLTALCLGAERGWVNKKEAKERALLCLNTFIKNPDDKNDIYADGKFGFFYHFLDMETVQRAGDTEISIIDTALFLCGAITAGEYFGGEVKKATEMLYQQVKWEEFFDKKYNQFYVGWDPNFGYMKYHWNIYTDEVILISLLAIGSPTQPVNSDAFYSWLRKKGDYKNGKEFIYSWQGGLFTYQYAHIWFDFRGIVDKENINWWQNSVNATKTGIEFCLDNANKHKGFGKNSWGITSCDTPQGYTMTHGFAPCVLGEPIFDGTISPSGPAGSIIFTPIESLNALRNFYNNYPKLWGVYGFKDSFNLDNNWYSQQYFGLGAGITLLMIENFRSEFIWRYFMKNIYVQKALEKAKFQEKSNL